MLKEDNVVDKIKLIRYNIPKNCTDLEKVRYIYMKLGNLFCYDFGVIIDRSRASIKLDYNNIGKFQTCLQISEVLAMILQKFNGNAEAKVIERYLPWRPELPHFATELRFKDNMTGESYNLILDLTLDLFKIQAGMQTKQFGYTTDDDGNYDIISSRECEKMDRLLNLVYNDEYKDIEIKKVKEYLDKHSMKLREKLTYMWQVLAVNFHGSHELMRYSEYLISTIFPKVSFKNFNLYNNNSGIEEFAILFIIKDPEQNEDIYLLFDKQLGIIFSNENNISDMLSSEWKTNSETLNTLIKNNHTEKTL